MPLITNLFFFFFLLLLSTIPLLAHATIIEDACSHTTHKDLCMATLSSADLPPSADMTDLTRAAIEAAAVKATETAAYVDELRKDQSYAERPRALQNCIRDCSESYEDAVEQLNDSLGEMEEGSGHADVVTWVSAVMSDAGTCEEGCDGVDGEEKDAIAARNEEFNGLCSNVLALFKLLPDDSSE